MTKLPELRPYQLKLVDDIEAAFTRHRTVLGVLPTGGGKTVIMAEIIRRENAAHRKGLVLAHRRELILQARGKVAAAGIVPGIIMPGETYRQTLDWHVGTVQSVHARGIRRESMPMPPADLVVIDEAHHASAETYRAILDAYPAARVLGVTATPCRQDGRGLGGIFETMVEGPQVAELISARHLVGTRVYAPPEPANLTGVRVAHGDYVVSELAERMDTQKLVGDIVTHWLRHGEGRQTAVFATTVGHSLHVRDAFREAGIWAEHIDGDTPTDERDAVLAQLAAGEITVLSNCQVLTEGFDCPDLGCCILARPTRSLGLYRQMIGRVLRPTAGKADAIVLDHAGATWQHGFAEDPIVWTLDPGKRPRNDTHDGRKPEHGARIVECTRCSALRVAGEPCRECGFMPTRRPQYVTHQEGELAAVDRARRRATPQWSQEERRDWYRQVLGYITERGGNIGAAYHRYRERFGGDKPPYEWRNLSPLEPTPDVRAWLRSRAIAYVKSRNAA